MVNNKPATLYSLQYISSISQFQYIFAHKMSMILMLMVVICCWLVGCFFFFAVSVFDDENLFKILRVRTGFFWDSKIHNACIDIWHILSNR